MNKDTESEQTPDSRADESKDRPDSNETGGSREPGESGKVTGDGAPESEAKPAPESEQTPGQETETSAIEPSVSEPVNASNADRQEQSPEPVATSSEELAGKAEASEPEEKPAQTARRSGRSGTPWRRRSSSGSRVRSAWSRRLMVILIVLLLLVGGLSWLVYWGWQQYQVLQQETADVISSQTELGQQVSRLNQRLESSISDRERLEQSLQDDQQALENMMVETAQRLSRRQDLEADRWPLEEALTLLRLAERRLQLDRDATIAISLLNAADQVLAGLTEAAVLPVRRQIAADRLALQSVTNADLNGAYFRLEAISERIASRQWSPAERLAPREQGDVDLSWTSVRDSLSSLVTVTRLEVPHRAPPLLSDFALWQQHSQLLTEQVQLALLAQNQPLFDAALEQLQQRVEAMSPELDLAAVAADLEALEGLALNPSYPDIHSSVEALEQYMTRVETEADASGDNGEGDE